MDRKKFLKTSAILAGTTILPSNSIFANNLLNNFENEIINFFQVCPKEMLDKLDNPISSNKNLGIAI